MSTPFALALIPRDGFFCKDGRDWFTSSSGRGHALEWPWPSTILGSLRTAWGRAQESATGTRFEASDWQIQTQPIRIGRTLALRRVISMRDGPVGAWNEGHRIWPMPLDAVRYEGREHVVRLAPRPPALPTLGRDDDEARENLWVPQLDAVEKPLSAPPWWRDSNMTRWLSGEDVEATDPDATPRPARRTQAHVGIDPSTMAADDEVLFSHDIIETLDLNAEWAIGVDAAFPNDVRPALARFGSDGRIALIETLEAGIFNVPASVLEAFRHTSTGLRLVVVSPACFAKGWLFDGFEARGTQYRGHIAGVEGELTLRAAIVPRPVHVSGWDMAAKGGRGAPKATSRAVAPGAVYFFERTDGRPFGEADARELWLSAHGNRTNEGFGRVVPGTWKSQVV